MGVAFGEEQQELARVARRWFSERLPSAELRRVIDLPEGFDRAHWDEMAAMGWQAMLIPEEYGGAGFGHLEAAVLIEEMGRALDPTPYLFSAVLAADLLLTGGSDAHKETLLPGIADGTRIVVPAVTETTGEWEPAGVATEAVAADDGWVITGTKRYVAHGHVADDYLVAARTGDGVSWFVVPAAAAERRRLDALDLTRALADVRFDGVEVPDDARLPAAGEDLLERAVKVGSVALAAEQVGLAERCLDMAVSYAKERHQFGRPIGSFQAVKHTCADMLVQAESARAAASAAAVALAAGDDELDELAPLAKSYCSEAALFCAGENIQVHGGIGFTWEHDAHLYFRRAKSTQLMFGDPAHHRRLLADRIGL